ncbi:hypothetical protein GOP47_0004444 [Adiantum capillus-veneris]|uniref:Pentatricopeptide repeat-containing protein n=1 Tax=Adiantum capillus-veneris TaxID=13818 RepID=A0A9D4V8P3_ADICA|nr:hypothetical protein GOP47_0004444 [Adiantum capillus-veneris]
MLVGEEALDCFDHMQGDGIRPNAVTYISVLKAYATLRDLEKGKKIHDKVAKQGLLQDHIELGTALLDMYAKCGDLPKAQSVLDSLPSRDVISWNALIAGYAQEGQGEQALICFDRMQHEGIFPDTTTYACILKACASIGAADKGKEIHDAIEKQGLLQSDIMVGNAVVDMYAKCGALSKAQEVLEKLPSRDVVTWNALITGFAQEGQGEQAVCCFEHMEREGIFPDAVTFLCMLNVCSHLGLVEEGYSTFLKMGTKYGVNPNPECFTCIVDLFGRAGHLEKAVQLIHEMPTFDCSANWIALLGACRKWGDVEVGRLAFEQAARESKFHGPACVLMSDIYAAAGMQENAKIIKAN